MDRAKQFVSYSPLKGFYELIHEKEILLQERMELSEEQYEELNFKINNIRKGDILKIKWYKEKGYVETFGKVSNIDLENGIIVIIKEKISIEDIVEIEI
ncbi:YolD-like family protein [Streptobacillus ratti]|uniref:YolD-like family protein n=1 Tax=Streptobacillus ratti TaxID=1720557 RepID=UPI000932EE83|nr:YolD-like family protein [Streptobacillus ratti]